ncbi:molybdenum cofactor guanylyltransferase [Mycobacterium sp.]|uniref:molybdenum cofactor guanylyltransferase n=1 Tax=Mycobacterium sp. TaxID=1785 RepID=UPI002D2A63CC|nr:molybdenum cofactor guanylyltransferase [Mycobacterium sp.]HZA10933.1 molybdenum cofactor guanylyltransferase [Mycobacterium sp.]
MTAAAPLAGVVLAGGASRRMGRDKATLPYRGATLVEYVVGVVKHRFDPVFVVAAPGQRLPAVQAKILRDEVRGVGPLAATGIGLRAARQVGAEWAFVCATDMPFLDTEYLDMLLGCSRNLAADVVLPWDGRDHYLAALYRTTLAERIDALVADGERSMAALVNVVDAQRIVTDRSIPLTNVNSATDLSAISS